MHLVLRVRGGGGAIQFNSLSQEISGKLATRTQTDLNKHEFVTKGINLVAKCENEACRIIRVTQYIQKGFGTFHLNEEVYE